MNQAMKQLFYVLCKQTFSQIKWYCRNFAISVSQTISAWREAKLGAVAVYLRPLVIAYLMAYMAVNLRHQHYGLGEIPVIKAGGRRANMRPYNVNIETWNDNQ
jgi:hypothetical protein